MSDRDQLFQRLCHEAVLACGTDHDAIERYVQEKMDEMDSASREMVLRDRDSVFRFQAPTASSTSQ